MTPGRVAARPLLVAATLVVLIGSGCSQVTSGEQSPGTTSATPTPTAAASNSTDAAASPTPPTPGPGATPGCDELTGPVHQLVHSENPDASLSAHVRELAAGVQDNALSAVASRLSGLAAQSDFDRVTIATQWGQFQQLCDLD